MCSAGSGKTLAFGLPILQRLQESLVETLAERPRPAKKGGGGARGAAAAGGSASTGHGPFALVVCPTRELATQVASHLQAVAPDGVRVIALVGGMSIDKQRRLLLGEPHVVVGTPGRLWELVSDSSCAYLRSLHSLRFFVLDEVDRMVEARLPRLPLALPRLPLALPQ